MHPLEKETLKIINQEQLLKTGEKVLVAVSAGPDSMALLHVMVRLVPVLDITVAAVYVNHGLRPDEAEEEHKLVEAEAQRLGIDFFTENADVKGLAGTKKLSIEHAARLLRYEILNDRAREWGAARIAVAHTADDQAEEILLRLIRGTARKGLAGMKTFRAGNIIRPFLRIAKSNLLEYLGKYSIPFLYDSSNSDTAYLRNRIRNDLLPYLADRYNPDIRQTLLRTANILQDEEELLETMTGAAFAATVSFIPETLEQVKAVGGQLEGRVRPGILLNLELFGSHPRAIQRRLLEKCCWHMDCEPSSRQIESILQLALQHPPGGELHLSDGLRVVRSIDQFSFAYPQGRGPFRGNLLPTALSLPETCIHAPDIYVFPELKKKLSIELLENKVIVSGDIFPTGEYLDSALFSFPLILRGPKPGDRFHPLGAPGSKKVNDFLSDQKIPQHARGQVPVLCADDLIIALPGLRIDHRYRVTDKTSRAVRVSWEDMESEVKGFKKTKK